MDIEKNKNYWLHRKAKTGGLNFLKNYKFDVVTVINLNAHISFDEFNAMLGSIREHCIKGARIIFINEYNNNNILYRWMKRSDFFDKYVERCEHWFFHYQEDFIKNIELIKWLEIEKTEVISANPPLLHVLASHDIFANQGYLGRFLYLFSDLIISQINNFSRADSGFIVGHVYRVKN